MRSFQIAAAGLTLSISLLAALANAEQNKADQNKTSTLAVCRADDIVGTKVKNPTGQDLGKVEDLVIDMATGKVRYAAVSFGGFLGVGDKLFAVPFQAMKLRHNPGDDTRHFELNVTKQTLEKAQGFDKKNWPDFANPKWGEEYDRQFINGTAAR
jgi:sporulation protein YlmC with PRC-barrel domain